MTRGMLGTAALALAVFVVVAFVSMWTVRGPRPGQSGASDALEGDARNGAHVIASYGCGSCHAVPGVRGADGRVGPPLGGMAGRRYIAGSLITTPENLAQWILDPQSVEPGTAMPNLGLSTQEAHDVVAYLYSLERR